MNEPTARSTLLVTAGLFLLALCCIFPPRSRPEQARGFVNVRYTFRRGRLIYGNL